MIDSALPNKLVLLKPSFAPPHPILFHKANVDNKVGIIIALRPSKSGHYQNHQFPSVSEKHHVKKNETQPSEGEQKKQASLTGQIELFEGGIIVGRNETPSGPGSFNISGSLSHASTFSSLLHQEGGGKRSKPKPNIAPKGNKRTKIESISARDTAYVTTLPELEKSISKSVGIKKRSLAPSSTASHFWSDISGVEYFCRNAGSCSQSLARFEELCGQSSQIALSVIWEDGTSNHSETSRKLCTPSRPCGRWNCACDRSVRALQTRKRVVAVAACLSVENGEYLYVLPLNSAHSSLESGGCIVE